MLFHHAFIGVAAALLANCATRVSPASDALVSVVDGQPLAETPSFAESTSSLDSTPSTDTTRTIGLAEAIQLALASNLDLALSRAQHEVAEARSSMASKALLPTFEVGGGVTRTDGMVQGAFGDFRDVD
ncbi:MAG: TolC family protein, partial [Candidatus Hydrogenedentes bacterium]|nr:TolC family protein [Candidatus Hydrogenedentota bacterium]